MADKPETLPEPDAWCDPSNPLNNEAFAWRGTLKQKRHSEPLYTDATLREAVRKARAEAFDEAAKVCDGLTHALDHSGASYHRPADADRCAHAIRALATKEANDAR